MTNFPESSGVLIKLPAPVTQLEHYAINKSPVFTLRSSNKFAVPTVMGIENNTAMEFGCFDFDAHLNTDICPMEQAAIWYSKHLDQLDGPSIPILREMFRLTALEAINATKRAREIERANRG